MTKRSKWEWDKNIFSDRYPIREFEPCSDEEFYEAIGLANAAFYKTRAPEEDWDRISINGKPLRYWINKLETKRNG